MLHMVTWCCIKRVQRTVSDRSATILAVLSCLPSYCGTLQTSVMLLCGPLWSFAVFSHTGPEKILSGISIYC